MKLRTDSSGWFAIGESMRYYSDAYRMISGPRESIRQ